MDRLNYRDSSSLITERTEKPPPFKLCFSKDQLLGRSNLRASNTDDPITPKFYSTRYEHHENKKEQHNEGNKKANETLEESANKQQNICQRLNRRHRLTSQAYGWWHEQGLKPIDSRIDYRRKTSDLVHFQMKIYAEDQKLQNIKH